MEKVKVRGLVPLVVAAITVAVFLSSCNLILHKAQVSFTNKTNVVLAPVSLGTVSVASLGVGSTSDYQLLDSGSYTLSVTKPAPPAGTVTWPGGSMTFAEPNSYTIVIAGTWPNLAAQVNKD